MRSLLVFLTRMHIAILLVVAKAAKFSNSPKEQTTLPKVCNAIKKLEKKLDQLEQNLENLTALISKTSTPGKELT